MKKFLSLVLAAAMLLAVTVPALAAEERCGGTLIAWLGGDPTSFNPDGAMDDFSLMTMENVFSKLVKFDYEGTLLPDLAASWDVSDDGLTYTFHLVETNWHDGVPFTADDVVWTIDTIKVYGITGYAFADVTVAALDEHTVQLTLTQPDASLIYNLSYYGAHILPKHLYDGQDFYTCNAALYNPVGTGPYKFVEFQQGVSMTLEANMDYFGGAPQTDTLIYSIIPDTSTAVQALLNQELDYLGQGCAPTELEGLKAQGYIVNERPFASRTYAAINMMDPNRAVADLAVRQAMAYGLDREAVLEKAYAGSGSIACGFAPEAIGWAYNPDAVMPQRDVAKAIEILESAGYTKDENGYYLTLEAPTMEEFIAPTTVFKDSMKDIGINVVISSMEPGAWMEMAFSGNYDVTILSGNHGPDASGMEMRVGTGGAINIMGYSNAEVDACYATGKATTNIEERAAAYKAAQVILSQDLPILPIWEASIYEVSAPYCLNTPMTAPGICTISDMSLTILAN